MFPTSGGVSGMGGERNKDEQDGSLAGGASVPASRSAAVSKTSRSGWEANRTPGFQGNALRLVLRTQPRSSSDIVLASRMDSR